MRKTSLLKIENDDFDFNEQLIKDSTSMLNSKREKEVFCFTSQQADEITKRCRFNCIVSIVNNVFVIKRI